MQQPLPLEQAPTNGRPFLALLGLGSNPEYSVWRKLFRGSDGVLRVATPLGDVWLSDAYSVNLVALGYRPP